jgi:hypothetical protein
MRKPKTLQVHEHTVLNSRWSPAPKITHSHAAGDHPHQHPDCGPAFYGYPRSKTKFTVKPTGEQRPWQDLEDWQRSFEIHLGTPTPRKGQPGYVGEGPGLLPVDLMVKGFKMRISRIVDHTKGGKS